MNNPNTRFARWLSLLLVIFILYGTTVAAAHRHGRTISAPANTTSHFDNEQGKNLINNKTGCYDCLICQLHQNFSTSLIALRFNDPPTRVSQLVSSIVTRDLVSQRISPVSGRAPPQAN